VVEPDPPEEKSRAPDPPTDLTQRRTTGEASRFTVEEIVPGNPAVCKFAFHVHTTWSQRIDDLVRADFKQRVHDAVCSDRPPPASGCEARTGICWEITYGSR
jgi:hypothetical protein